MRVTPEILDRFLDGDVSADEHTAVLSWLESHDNLMDFAQRAELHSDLRRSLRRQRLQQEVLSVCDSTTSGDAPRNVTSASPQPSNGRDSKTRTTYVVAALLATTAASLLVYLLGFYKSPAFDKSPPSLARLVYQSNARWGAQDQLPGDTLGKGIPGVQSLFFTEWGVHLK